MNKRPLILVTNDDGITAPGIRTLIAVMNEIGDVVVVAPDSPQSGKGHAITLHNPLWLHKSNIFDGIDDYECTGTPVDCVKLAKHENFREHEQYLEGTGIWENKGGIAVTLSSLQVLRFVRSLKKLKIA